MDLDDQYGTSQEERALELQMFRERWREELNRIVPQNAPAERRRNAASNPPTRSQFEIAAEIFREGIKEERSGRLHEAVSLYRRAMQIDPEIEFKIEKSAEGRGRNLAAPKNAERAQDVPQSSSDADPGFQEEYSVVSEDSILESLLSYDLVRNGVCKPAFPPSTTHLCMLPPEVVQYILQWVVSSELDFVSLERFATVCKGFYKTARDPLIWKLACQRIWGASCVRPEEMNYGSWRDMLINRPQVRLNGVYISRIYYERPGEASFVDQSSPQYRPWYNVLYYRYLRFFADGTVLYANTPEEPINMVSRLRTKTPVAVKDQPQILSGRYMLSAAGDSVIMFVQREILVTAEDYVGARRGQRRQKTTSSIKETLTMELAIRNTRERLHSRLDWRRFVITRLVGNSETVTNIDMNHLQFPPVYFSRVKSYGSVSEKPLC